MLTLDLSCLLRQMYRGCLVFVLFETLLLHDEKSTLQESTHHRHPHPSTPEQYRCSHLLSLHKPAPHEAGTWGGGLLVMFQATRTAAQVPCSLNPNLASHPSCECSNQRQSSAIWVASSSGAATATSSAACSKQPTRSLLSKRYVCLFSVRLPPQLSSPCLKLATRPASNHHCSHICKSPSLLVLQNALEHGSTEVLGSSVLSSWLCNLNIEWWHVGGIRWHTKPSRPFNPPAKHHVDFGMAMDIYGTRGTHHRHFEAP